jgi:hypothetical protein
MHHREGTQAAHFGFVNRGDFVGAAAVLNEFYDSVQV